MSAVQSLTTARRFAGSFTTSLSAATSPPSLAAVVLVLVARTLRNVRRAADLAEPPSGVHLREAAVAAGIRVGLLEAGVAVLEVAIVLRPDDVGAGDLVRDVFLVVGAQPERDRVAEDLRGTRARRRLERREQRRAIVRILLLRRRALLEAVDGAVLLRALEAQHRVRADLGRRVFHHRLAEHRFRLG